MCCFSIINSSNSSFFFWKKEIAKFYIYKIWKNKTLKIPCFQDNWLKSWPIGIYDHHRKSKWHHLEACECYCPEVICWHGSLCEWGNFIFSLFSVVIVFIKERKREKKSTRALHTTLWQVTNELTTFVSFFFVNVNKVFGSCRMSFGGKWSRWNIYYVQKSERVFRGFCGRVSRGCWGGAVPTYFRPCGLWAPETQIVCFFGVGWGGGHFHQSGENKKKIVAIF
jgi:hypothetical protein